MALLMNFMDDSGNNYEPAYWRAVQINISATGGNINLIFYAYKDAQSFAANRRPITGGMKQYVITGKDFMGIAMAPPVGDTLYDALAHAADTYALAKLDTPDGTLDENGKPVFVSFFNGATQV